MKIAILSPFYPFRGGLAQLNARLFTELRKYHEVQAFSFITLYPKLLFPGKTQFVEEGDNVAQIDNKRVLSSVNPFSYIKTAKCINAYCPDILIIPYWLSLLAPAFGSVAGLINKKTRVISLVHNAIPHERRFFDKAFARYFFRKCDGFIVFSEPVKKDLTELILNSNILLTPHPIYDSYKEKTDKVSASKELDISPDKKNLLFFGLIRDYKGLDILIKSMSFLDDSYQLIIAGESYGDFGKYRSLIESSPLKENIKVFERYIPDDMVPVLFSASDLLVLPYRGATQSGVAALAYHLELPMVSTDVGALGETLRSAKTGLVVDDITPESIANGIKSYFENNYKTVFMPNIQSEKKRLSWDAFAQKANYFFQALTIK